jgi:hypothetical protein
MVHGLQIGKLAERIRGDERNGAARYVCHRWPDGGDHVSTDRMGDIMHLLSDLPIEGKRCQCVVPDTGPPQLPADDFFGFYIQ